MSIKEKLMNKMMDTQFQNMPSEEKKQMMETMMDKFFSTMSEDEKKQMMSGMMSKFMGQSMGDHPMMGMMSMMMGRRKKGSDQGGDNKMPWDICREMMTGIKETADTARFATAELKGLFDEWCRQIEKEILDYIKEKGSINIKDLSDKFSLSEESIKFLLTKMANSGLIDFKL